MRSFPVCQGRLGHFEDSNSIPWNQPTISRCMHALFFFGGNFCWIHDSLQQFPESRSASSFLFLPVIAVSMGSSNVNEIDASQSSSDVEFGLLVCPFLLFFLVCLPSGFPHFGPQFTPHILRSGSCLNFCLSLPGPQKSLWRFYFNEVHFVTPFHESDQLRFTSTIQ